MDLIATLTLLIEKYVEKLETIISAAFIYLEMTYG